VIDYEILLMLDPELSEEQQGAVVARTRELIEKGGGTVDRHDAWGRRKLAYEINKKTDGAYHLLLFSCGAETLDEVSRVLKIDDAVMRHMATRRAAEGSTGAALPPTGPPEPVAVAPRTRNDVEDVPAAGVEDDEAPVELEDDEPDAELDETELDEAEPAGAEEE
jgi:small subunit ribosomal protein S6